MISLNKLVQDIVQQVSPEKIFLLSVCMHRHCSENIFVPRAIECEKVACYDLLVLAAENEQRNNDALQDAIESKCGEAGFVTAFVFRMQQFNTWLMNGHPFACKVYHAAQLCYDAGMVPLATPAEYDAAEVQNRLITEFNRNVNLAAEFLSGAELFTIRKQFALAAFHLHQAAEQLYTGIIHIITGLRLQTHNLDKLHRYSKHLLEGLPALFPRDTQQEKHLFKLLQKAYIESRYGNDYCIKPEELCLLHRRIVKLLELCRQIARVHPG